MRRAGSLLLISLTAASFSAAASPSPSSQQTVVEAAFTQDSYVPGSVALLRVWGAERITAVKVFHSGPERTRTMRNDLMNGAPVTAPVGAERNGKIHIGIGRWPSGLYFARVTAAAGRIAFAPFVVRPPRLGLVRVAIVMPTFTWQAYNFRDDDGDGRPDTWYAGWQTDRARLHRPFLHRGVPLRFRSYDLPFLHWLARTHRNADFLADSDLAAIGGRRLTRAYDLIVFPGHDEYATTKEYDAVEGFRDRGGSLAFLTADDFDWRISVHGGVMTREAKWRDLGRPQAALVGAQYDTYDMGTHRGAWVVRRTTAARWLFAGTGLHDGSRFGSAGIEIDHTAESSPAGTIVLAEIPDVFGAGHTAQMTYYVSRSGAKVFDAGAFTLAGSALQPTVARLLANLWQHLTS